MEIWKFSLLEGNKFSPRITRGALALQQQQQGMNSWFFLSQARTMLSKFEFYKICIKYMCM